MWNVLLVASDRATGSPIADRLEEAGYDLMWCPGPQAPDFVCGASRGSCPLSTGAHVAVVDGWLESDRHRQGMPSWHLASYYRTLGAAVVVLVGPNGFPSGVDDPFVRTLPRSATPDEVVAAVDDLTRTTPDRRPFTISLRTNRRQSA